MIPLNYIFGLFIDFFIKQKLLLRINVNLVCFQNDPLHPRLHPIWREATEHESKGKNEVQYKGFCFQLSKKQ